MRSTDLHRHGIRWVSATPTTRVRCTSASPSRTSRTETSGPICDGRTGSSTVRRSFAALLRERLGLHAQPRDPAKPDHFDRYALSPADDAMLTGWMHEHLTIAVWASHGNPLPLAEIEKQILKAWSPPLNLTHVYPTRLTALVKAARSTMPTKHEAYKRRVDPLHRGGTQEVGVGSMRECCCHRHLRCRLGRRRPLAGWGT